MSDLTYLYCLVRSARTPPVLPDTGMPGAASVRLLDAGGGLRLAVSSVPPADYNQAALAEGLKNLDWVGRRAIAHEAVVEHFLTAPAVLPMQMFTLFTSDDRALAYVAGERRRIDRLMTALERKHEWGVRLTFDEQSAREAVEAKHAALSAGSKRTRGRAAPKLAERATAGAAYLARKRDLLDVSRVELAGAKKAADRLFAGMSRAAARSLRRRSTEQLAPGSRLLLDAAFLVPTARTRGFRASLRRQASLLPAGVVVSLTGPWPPYNFIDAPARPRSTARR